MKAEKLDSRYCDYLKDESRLQGKAEWIVFPKTEAEVEDGLKEALKSSLPVTFQGSRTGITGAGVPTQGMVMSLEGLNEIGEIYQDESGDSFMQVQAGAKLCDITDFVFKKSRGTLFFPPNPTEKSASIGGMFACNAAGMNHGCYGKTSHYVEALTFVLYDGTKWVIHRGDYQLNETGCSLPDGKRIRISDWSAAETLPFFRIKNGMDLIDFLAGSEGMFGVVTELTLKLKSVQPVNWGTMFFFEQDEVCYSFLDTLEESWNPFKEIITVEYFDEKTLDYLRIQREQMSSLKKMPPIPEHKKHAVYLELSGQEEEAIEMVLMEPLTGFEEAGGKEEDTWAGADTGEMEKFEIFRHAVPEAVNCRVDQLRKELPGFCKRGLDYSFRTKKWSSLIQLYHKELEAFQTDGVVFGHLAELHLHVNLLPKDEEEKERAERLAERLAEMVLEDGGCLASENGLGKVKKSLIHYLTDEQFQMLNGIKYDMDPQNVLNPGNLL